MNLIDIRPLSDDESFELMMRGDWLQLLPVRRQKQIKILRDDIHHLQSRIENGGGATDYLNGPLYAHIYALRTIYEKLYFRGLDSEERAYKEREERKIYQTNKYDLNAARIEADVKVSEEDAKLFKDSLNRLPRYGDKRKKIHYDKPDRRK